MSSILLIIGSKNCGNCQLLPLISNILREKTKEILLEVIEYDIEDFIDTEQYTNLNLKEYIKWTPNIILIDANVYLESKKLSEKDLIIYCTKTPLDKLPYMQYSLNCQKIYKWIEDNYKKFDKLLLEIQ